MSETVPTPDVDPGHWADPAATYDTLAADYALQFLNELDDKPFDRELLSRFADTVRERPGTTGRLPVCDLGCGPGQVGAFVAARGVPVVGIDLSAGMVEEARRCFPALSFTQGDMTALDLPDRSLAGLVCFYALIHIPRALVPRALGHMRRVVAEGGPVLLAVHGGEGTLHATRMVERPANLHATLFSLPELCTLVEEAELTVVESHQRDPYPDEHPTPRLYVWASAG